jgi:hypothetical protein
VSGAVYSQVGGTGEFEECVFERNGQVGVQVQGGSVQLTACRIVGHTYGAFVASGAKIVDAGTKFERIDQKDIFYAQ